MTQTLETTKPASQVVALADRTSIAADGRDVAVVTIEIRDPKGRVVPDACNMLTFRLQGEGRILGVGNGDPSYLGEDHPKDSDCHEFQIPAFNGLAQVLIQSSQKPSALTLTASSERLKAAAVTIQTE
jgi:beta-galactosidase